MAASPPGDILGFLGRWRVNVNKEHLRLSALGLHHLRRIRAPVRPHRQAHSLAAHPPDSRIVVVIMLMILDSIH